MHFELCKAQQHSQKQEFLLIMVLLKLLRGFKPAGLTVCIFFLSFCSLCLLILGFRVSFCIHEGTWPYRSLAQMPCLVEVGVSFVVLGILELQIARH
jgi:hypothetical protein